MDCIRAAERLRRGTTLSVKEVAAMVAARRLPATTDDESQQVTTHFA
jgi:hypothetical protein